jgi:hypothetical protein
MRIESSTKDNRAHTWVLSWFISVIVHSAFLVGAGRPGAGMPSFHDEPSSGSETGFMVSFASARGTLELVDCPETRRYQRITEESSDGLLNPEYDHPRGFTSGCTISCSIDDRGHWR